MKTPLVNTKFISQIADRDDGIVIRPRNGADVYLNKTAAFIFKEMQNNPGANYDDLINQLSSRYPQVPKDQLRSDATMSIRKMWESAVVTYPQDNPFSKDRNKRIGNDYTVSLAYHDDIESILPLFNDSVLMFDPYVEIPEIIILENLTYLFLHDLWQCYLLKKNGQIVDLIIYEKAAAYQSIVAMICRSNDYQLLSSIQDFAHSNQTTVMANVSNTLYPEAKSALNFFGMEMVGTLRKETRDGDVDVYYTIQPR